MSEIRTEAQDTGEVVRQRFSLSKREKFLLAFAGLSLGLFGIFCVDTIQTNSIESTLDGEARAAITGYDHLGGSVGRSVDVLDPNEHMLIVLEDGTTCLIEYKKHGSGVPDSFVPDEGAVVRSYEDDIENGGALDGVVCSLVSI